MTMVGVTVLIILGGCCYIFNNYGGEEEYHYSNSVQLNEQYIADQIIGFDNTSL